ncbi:pantoate--beta-alanine ligase [Cyclobacteriaceae bacterium]|nr:pantoate--beta-alanine ligase [Cyclobacteriaceae bacterium]
MFIANSPSILQEYFKQTIDSQKTIGFVPTMGALHKGHLSLVKSSKTTCDITVVSIFVNPTQFNNSHDFEKYPNTITEDQQLLKEEGVDVLFFPTKENMYPEASTLTFNFGFLETTMEGEFRPGHFNGVATIVTKLFHIVNPTHAFFGQKDLQQVAVIQSLVQSLSFPLELIVVPTSRDQNGLALSSRNLRLTKEQRQDASLIYKILNSTIDHLPKQAANQLLTESIATLSQQGFETEYLRLVEMNTLKETEYVSNKKLALCIATNFHGVRLIDNLIIEPIC